MQISRHWRLNLQRYRLQGVRYQNGDLSLQSRPLEARQEESKLPTVKLETPNKNVVAYRKGA